MKGSHVLYRSPDQIHATFMSDAAQTVSRLPLDLSWCRDSHQFDVVFMFRHLIGWFACARLSDSQLIPSGGTFVSTLTTLALYQRSFRWFEACSCKPAPRGPPSSFVQLRTLYEKVRSWRTTLRVSYKNRTCQNLCYLARKPNITGL